MQKISRIYQTCCNIRNVEDYGGYPVFNSVLVYEISQYLCVKSSAVRVSGQLNFMYNAYGNSIRAGTGSIG